MAITKALKSGVLKRGTPAGLAILTLSAALGLGSGFATAAENPDTASGESVLQGSWEVTVQPYICQTGAQVGLPFTSLLTFAKGQANASERTAAQHRQQRAVHHCAWRSAAERLAV